MLDETGESEAAEAKVDRRQLETPVAVERRKGGRPKAAEPGVAVCAWVPESEADKLVVIAIRRRQSVSSLVKELIRKAVRTAAI